MDDNLVALTIWESQRNKERVKKTSLCSWPEVDTIRSERELADESKKKELLRVRNSKVGDLDCFPCLHSAKRDTKDNRELSSTASDNSGESASVDFAMTDERDISPPPLAQADNSGTSATSNYWLMRLFQSNLFDMHIAIGYLYSSKDSDIQAYLANKLFVSCLVCSKVFARAVIRVNWFTWT